MATMDSALQRGFRGPRANGHAEGGGSGRRAHHGNKRWVAEGVTGRSGTTTPHTGSDNERWERGGHRGGGRGRGRSGRGRFGSAAVPFRRNGALDGGTTGSEGEHSEMEEEHDVEEPDVNEPETPEEREIFWQDLVKAREAERKRAIAEGKMDDPLKPKRLEDAITMVGTCMDMCPRFERYRRERENNLFEWETIPGTKRVDHKRAVKAYERAAGDKTLPSDLRPPDVLKHTLNYLFRELLPCGGFSESFNFVRDRSRAVRNDFTMQHEMGPVAIECHDRCARFHILALHIERERSGFSVAMEEQQLMNTLQSLKEFYEDQRGHYQSPTELEMRVYHRLVHIRDQRERHDDIPQALLDHPVFQLTTKFRARVQAKSAPITKTSPLAVDAEAMQIFAELAEVLRREGNVVMTYLVACILERHFGKGTIEDIESIRNNLSLSDIIDGYSGTDPHEQNTDIDISVVEEGTAQTESTRIPRESPQPIQSSGDRWVTETSGPRLPQSIFPEPAPTNPPSQSLTAPVQSAFSNLKTVPNAFGSASFGIPGPLKNTVLSPPPTSAFISTEKIETSSLTHKTTEAPNATVGFPVPSSTSSLPHFGFVSQTEQQPHIPVLFPRQPLKVDGFSVSPAKRSVFGSEASASTLNPSATTFIPSNVTSTSSFGATPTSLFNIPSTSTHSSIESHRPSTLNIIVNEQAVPIPQPPSQESSTTDATITEIPFVSSPPSMDPAPLEGMTGQPSPPQPPPLSRRQPISLPPTPTATVFIPPSFPSTRKSIFGSLKNIQTSPLSAAPTEILSPLVLHSPASRSLSWVTSLSRRESMHSPLKAVVSAADVEAAAEPPTEKLNAPLVPKPSPVKKPSLDIMKATTLHFARRGWLVKQSFSKWRQRLDDHAEWVEACRRSTLYKEKARAERFSRSVGSPPTANGRTHQKPLSETRVPLKKRLRERLSGEYRPPASDAELAKRFEKNHEDHARRWARGSFLGVLKGYLESTRSPVPDNWCAWLSLNQESDGTAIWLEQKFDMPDSGKWKNENVFQIPISRSYVELSRSYPGVVIFERTPLTGVADILGRKYRVLEDCTRLREIVEAFPTDRHYVPSLLCIAWSERDPDSSKDFDDMVESMVDGGVLMSTHELLISTAALDMESKLDTLLHVIPFDLEGRLVKRVSLNDLFDIWERQWETATKWHADCNVYGEFDWDLYAKLLEGCARLSIHIIDSVISLLRDDGARSGIPHLQLAKGMDSDSTFGAILDWLQRFPEIGSTTALKDDIRGHQNLGRDFPTTSFPSQLYSLARSVTVHIAGVDPEAIHHVSRSRLDHASKEFQTLTTFVEEEIKAYRIAKFKPSKRLASFAEPSLDSSRASTPRSKKQRVSLSDGLATDEESASPSPCSPSPSTATSVPSEPVQIVTYAMLRSLTKDIRAKYGVTQLSSSVSR